MRPHFKIYISGLLKSANGDSLARGFALSAPRNTRLSSKLGGVIFNASLARGVVFQQAARALFSYLWMVSKTGLLLKL